MSRVFTRVLLGLCLLTLLVTMRTVMVLSHQWHLPKAWIKRPLWVEGVVVRVAQDTPAVQRFILRVDHMSHKGVAVDTAYPVRLQVGWYYAMRRVEPGERWRLPVKLKPPSGLRNPGGFDYARSLMAKHISALATVDTSGRLGMPILVRGVSTQSVRHRLQIHLRQQLQAQCLDPAAVGLVMALLTGNTLYLDHQHKALLQQTGTSHLVAVSGLHIGASALLGYLLFGSLWRLFPRGMLWCPAQHVAAVGGLLVALLYATFSGFAYPAERAYLMLFVYTLGVLLCRKQGLLRLLWLAALIVVLVHPLSLWQISFWYSFLALFWIAVTVRQMRGCNKWMTFVVLQCVLFVGLLPVTCYVFHTISWLGLFANVVAIPFVEFVLLPSAFLAVSLGSLPGCAWLWSWLSGVCHAFWSAQQWLSLQMHSTPFTISHGWQVVSALLGLLCVLLCTQVSSQQSYRRPAALMGVGLTLLLLGFTPWRQRPPMGALRLSVLSVGQGLGVEIETAHHVLLYDTGPHLGSFDAGARVMVPYLLHQHWRSIDAVVISHGDNDHVGGLESVMRTFPVKQLISSVPSLYRMPRGRRCQAGQHWVWDGVNFDMLYPGKAQLYIKNNSSCVLRVRAANLSVLLPGDLEREGEAVLVKTHPTPGSLHADVLIAPHHGSRTSSSPRLIRAVQPRQVIFSIGRYNRFHFPSKRIVRRYHALQVGMKRTASGAVVLPYGSSGEFRLQTPHN